MGCKEEEKSKFDDQKKSITEDFSVGVCVRVYVCVVVEERALLCKLKREAGTGRDWQGLTGSREGAGSREGKKKGHEHAYLCPCLLLTAWHRSRIVQ